MKKILTALAAVTAITLTPMVAHAVPYGPGDVSISLDDSTPPPGGDVTATLFAYQGGEDIEIDVSLQGEEPNIGASFRLPRTVVGTVTADANGDATAVLVAPDAAGTYVVTGTGLTSGAQAQATFTVETEVVPPTTTPGGGGGGGLPPTGGDSDQLVQTGAIVLAMGAGLVGVAALRRRRTTAA